MTSVRPSILRYGELTSPEAARSRERGDLLILPLGATEQHGGGLPLATDTFRAEHVAEEVARRLDGRAFVLPAVGYGVSPHHATLPGTITLPPTLLIELLVAIATGLASDGWRRILVVSGHGGNSAALGVVQQTLLHDVPDLAFAWSPITPLARSANAALPRASLSGHSGESETAQLLAIAPDLVDRDRLAAGATDVDALGSRARLSRTATPSLAVTFDRYAPNGVLGDPRTATAEAGEAILDEVVTTLVEFSRELLSLTD